MKYYWDDIIGHQKSINQLEKDILNDKLSHAYLFVGPAEIGKYAVAKKFANILICEKDYCRTCNDCLQFKNNLHPDIITVNKLWIDKVNDNLEKLATSSNFNQIHRAKKKAKTDVISIDDIRAFSQKIYEKKQSKYKICLIKNLERLQPVGANALLKMLEEPPKGTIFILTSSYPDKILTTILSRVRKIYFSNVTDQIILDKLQTQTDTENLSEIISIAQGRPPVAMKLLKDSSLFEKEKNRFHQIANILSKPELKSDFLFVERILENQHEITRFLDALTRFLRTLILEKSRNSNNGLSQKISYENLIKIQERTQKTKKMIKQNINKRLVLENLILDLKELT
jgi:DNA polymerase-3 subunit delta'